MGISSHPARPPIANCTQAYHGEWMSVVAARWKADELNGIPKLKPNPLPFNRQSVVVYHKSPIKDMPICTLMSLGGTDSLSL